MSYDYPMTAQKKFVEALATKVSKQQFPDYIKKTAMQIADEIRETGEVYISAELDKREPKKGQSKIGGKPDVEADFEWPCEDGTDSPLAFIAQINLAEVHPHDFENKLPAQGMVWFFSIAEGDRAYGGEIDSSTTTVLHAPSPGPLKPHAIPADLAENEDATIEEHLLAFGPCVSLPGRVDQGIVQVIDESLRELGGRRGPVFMLNVHDDSSGIMLADIDCYTIAQNAFGEGALSFVLTPKDLKNGALAKADTHFSGGT
jgi:hypothetical protein